MSPSDSVNQELIKFEIHSMKKSKKLFAFLIPLVLVLAALVIYLYPKASLFDNGKRAWNFRNMPKLFPSKSINASKTPYPLRENPIVLEGLTYEFDNQKLAMEELLIKTETTGLLVLKNNLIVLD
jgi:hypothetical protein